MNFVENNGKKVAAILCVASAFPVVATVVAAKEEPVLDQAAEEPGWHGDRYVNEDKTVAKGWQEIEGKSYYFSEDGTVNSSKTENATTASVSSNITGEVKETVTTASQEAVKQETEEKAVVDEAPVQTEEVKTDTTETTTDTTTDTTDTTETPEAPAAPVETPSVDTTTQAPEQTPEQNPTPAPEAPAAPEQTPAPAPAPEETVTPAPEQTASSLGDRISSSAQELVGVTDGLWCTQVVQQALANAGVSDAYQLWPDQYQGVYGYYTDSPLAGDLIYYNNGGRGVDHIAVYIGNGQAVHGNYNGKTVIADAYQSGMGNPQYIRVVR